MKHKSYIATYVIVIGILIILLMLTFETKTNEGFQDSVNKRFALIIRGEAFRKGGQLNRDDGKIESYDEQKGACDTHMALVNKIISAGYNVDIYIDTYHTDFDNDLTSWYGEYVSDKRFHTTKFDSQRTLIKDALDMLKGKMDTYDALMILRVDLYLKPQFIEEYDPNTDTVEFPFVLWTLNVKTPGGNPMVSDTIFHFPKKHFDKLHGLYTGDAWGGGSNHAFLDVVPLEYEKDYSLLTTNFHDSDSAKDFNPYYKIIGRPENPKWHDGSGKVFPRDFQSA